MRCKTQHRIFLFLAVAKCTRPQKLDVLGDPPFCSQDTQSMVKIIWKHRKNAKHIGRTQIWITIFVFDLQKTLQIPWSAVDCDSAPPEKKRKTLVRKTIRRVVFVIFWHSVPCSIWFRVGFRSLSSYSFSILFHYHCLVPSASGYGSPAYFANFLVFSSIIISSFYLVPGRVPDASGILPSNFLVFCSIIISWFPLDLDKFCDLFPYFYGILFHHDFLIPSGSG